MQIQQLTYAEIQPYWQQLWPNRNFEATSAMAYLGGYHAYEAKDICYYAVTVDGAVAGVNSCHNTGDRIVRSRGLWVLPEHRGLGLGQELLNYNFTWAQEHGYTAVWSYPKQAAFGTYQSVGFSAQSPWITDEAGNVNCYVIKFL